MTKYFEDTGSQQLNVLKIQAVSSS